MGSCVPPCMFVLDIVPLVMIAQLRHRPLNCRTCVTAAFYLHYRRPLLRMPRHEHFTELGKRRGSCPGYAPRWACLLQANKCWRAQAYAASALQACGLVADKWHVAIQPGWSSRCASD